MTRQIIPIVACILLFIPNLVKAQDEVDAIPKAKIFDHQVGVQANELIRQVFNFNNSAGNSINNPYLLTYSLNLAKSGWGLRLGIGPDFNTFKDDDGITRVQNDVNRLNARAGIEKAFKLSERWSAGAGADFVYGSDVSYSKTFVRTFDSTSTDISSRTSTTGYGGMGWVRYHITPRILIGTETSFYYKTGDYKQKITITQKTSNGIGKPFFETTITETDNKLKAGQVNLPMVFYLIVKF